MLQKIIRVNPFLAKPRISLYGTESNGSCSRKIFDHFSKNERTPNLDLFPNDMKRVTTKKVPQIYIAEEEIAHKIAVLVSRFQLKDVPLFELNPGPCILSNALLKTMNPKKFGLIEQNEEFLDIQMKFKHMHGSEVILKAVKHICGYNNMANFILENCKRRQWHEQIVFQLFTCLRPGEMYRFIMDIVRQRRFFFNGRAEIFALMPSLEYMKLTAGPETTYWLYTQYSCMFQILFEYEMLAEIPRANLLPWRSSKLAYGGKIKYDVDMFHLVRMVPKQDLFSTCSCEDLLLLRFFVYQCFFKRKGYIIPKLEKWIPGIGGDLIMANFERHSPLVKKPTNPSDGSLKTLLANQFDIFTRCGSLTPLQIFALFHLFKQYPQYKQSCFHQQCNDFYANKSIVQNLSVIYNDENKEADAK